MSKWKQRYMSAIEDIKTARDKYLELGEMMVDDIKSNGKNSHFDTQTVVIYYQNADMLSRVLDILLEYKEDDSV